MSHIDSFRHELVGLFGYLPVYHPLEVIQGDFHCTPNQILIGGGSGEHPALVIEHPTCAVARFLEQEAQSRKELKAWKSIYTPYLNPSTDEILTFYEWSEDTHQNFRAICTSPSLPNALTTQNLKEWLILGVGEFIFFAMPDLAPAIMESLDDPYKGFFHMSYNNIMVVPPNFPVYSNGGNRFFK
ncbi:hypothetical protein [Pontibacter sp. G13]|uniref:hypothetical protein n=1 Tax=Pontibacter sp. G13 TaxID=3074898 RepID=UPI00288C1D66|nr:hypothetical protein [Pontibacter sp. G13]WNJ19359.1 hypothetical protein RJD25_02605 [Pontibacter sp. G13]